MVPVSRLASCAAASMPRASPETTRNRPCRARREAARASVVPPAEASREPTMATAGRCRQRGIAAHVEHRRRLLDVGERCRIARLDREQRPAPARARRFEFRLRAIRRADRSSGRPRRLSARQLRQGGECRGGAAVVVDQFAERDRADVLGADQAQTGEALGVVERRLRQRRRRRPAEIRPEVAPRCRCFVTLWHRSSAPRRR